MSKSASSPSPSKVGKAAAQSYQQILNLYPKLFSMEQQYSPQETGLDLSNLMLALNGSPGGTRTVTTSTPVKAWQNTVTGQITTTDPTQGGASSLMGPHGRRGTANSGSWLETTIMQPGTTEQAYGASPGLLDINQQIQQRLNTDQNAANTVARQAGMADLRAINPGQAALNDQLTQQASMGLDAGMTLSPEERYRVVNPVRQDWAARGLGGSAPGQLGEALNLYTAGNNLLQQRQQFAGDVNRQNAAFYTLPAYQNTAPSTAQLFGLGSQYSQQPGIASQLGLSGGDIYDTMYNAQASKNINDANAANAQTANFLQVGGALGAALLL